MSLFLRPDRWLMLLLLWPSWSLAQEPVRTTRPDWSGKSWEEFVAAAESAYGIRIYYPDLPISREAVTVAGEVPLPDFIRDWAGARGLSMAEDARGWIYLTTGEPISGQISLSMYAQEEISGKPDAPEAENESFIDSKGEFIPKVITVGTAREGLGKRSFLLTGVVRDASTRDPVPRASLTFPDLDRGVFTEENGTFRVTLPKGTHRLVVRDFGHDELRLSVEMLSGGEVELRLNEREVELEEVTISSQRDNPIQNTAMGFERINPRAVREVPLVLGERDILKVATLLPGVQSVGEGSAGFNVRGAPADQNLFYLEHVPVYNTSHLFGFFSAFHADALGGMSLYKSNIPAEYGGRLAAIFDIEAREASKDKVQVEGGISPVTGRLLIGTPIQKGKSSAMVGLRSTYSNWLLGLIPNQQFNQSKIYFGDASTLLSFALNDKNQLKLFGYFSLDDTRFGRNTYFRNQNLGASASWLHFFDDRNDMEITLVHSRLGLEVENDEIESEAYARRNALFHTEVKAAATLRPSERHRIRLGINSILYQNDRGEFLPFGQRSLIVPVELGKEQGLETGLFAEDELRISERIGVQAGIRYNVYSFLGPDEVFTYEPGKARLEENLVDTLRYGAFQPIRTSQGLDLRLSIRYALGLAWAVKASAARLHQYTFLLSNTIALAPTDTWKLSDANIDPMRGDQVSVGLFGNLAQGRYQVSAEAYYKDIENLVEYRDGANLLVNEVPEWDVLQGRLQAAGLELVVKKTTGRLQGWVNYTYSRAIAQVDGGQPDLQVNFGLPYPANYDRPHAANLVVNYRFNRRVSLSANGVYATGKPITYPTSIFFLNQVRLVSFTTRNEYRVPDYLRFDVSVNIEGNLKAKKLAHGSWAFSIYNLTGRDNVYNVFFSSVSGRLQGYKVSIFAVPIFSATYNFKLGNYES